MMVFSGIDDLTIDGQGAIFRCHDYWIDAPIQGVYWDLMSFQDCDRLHVCNFTVNMLRPPFTFGTCAQVHWSQYIDQRSFDMWVATQDLDYGRGPVTSLANMTLQVLTHHTPLGTPGGFKFFHVEDTTNAYADFLVPFTQPGSGGTIHRVTGNMQGGPGVAMLTDGLGDPSSPGYGQLKIYDLVLAVHHFGSQVCLGLADCDDVMIWDVAVHAYPGQGIQAWQCSDLAIDAFRAIPDPMRPWPATLTSDGLYVAHCRGTVEVTGCHFEGCLDDGINIHTTYYPATSYENDVNEFRVHVPAAHGQPASSFRPGDVIQLCDAEARAYAERAIASAHLAWPDIVLVFPGTGGLPLDPGGAPPKAVCNRSWFPDSVSIVGCTVRTIRGQGMRLYANTNVEQCVFQDISASAIVLGPIYSSKPIPEGFREGPSVGNVEIVSCTVDRALTGWGFNDFNHGAISIQTSLESPTGNWSHGKFSALSQVRVDSCTLTWIGGAAVTGRSASGITVEWSSFGNISLLASLMTNPQGLTAASSLLYFNEAGDIRINSNQVLAGYQILNGATAGPVLYGSWIEQNNLGF